MLSSSAPIREGKPVTRSSTFTNGKISTPPVRKTCVPRVLSRDEAEKARVNSRGRPLRSTSSAGQLMDARRRVSLDEKVSGVPLLWKFGVLRSHIISHDLNIQQSPIAEGAFAAIFSGRLVDDRSCVIKVPHERFIGSEHALAVKNNFENEANLLSQLNHPNIIEYFAVFKSGICRCPVLIVEEMDCNLTEMLTMNDDVDICTQMSICSDITSAVSYLHSMNVIHGNITSNNILISMDDDTCTAKLCDFMQSKSDVYTPKYVPSYEENSSIFFTSPEFAMCPDPLRLTKECDIFACGVVFLHVGTQRPPQLTPMWSESPVKMKATKISEMDRRRQHLSCLGVNHPLKQLIISCLQDDPRQRPEAERLDTLVQTQKQTTLQTDDYCHYDGVVNRSYVPVQIGEMKRSASAPLYSKMRIRASSVTSSTSSWSFRSSTKQTMSPVSDSSSEEPVYTSLRNRQAASEARLNTICNNLDNSLTQKPNKSTKIFRWKSLLPFGRGKKPNGPLMQKHCITNPTNFRRITSANSDSNMVTDRCLASIPSQWV